MSADWANLEGHTINGVLPLLRLLGSSERSAVFLSRTTTGIPTDVAVKLIPAISGRAETLLPRWRAATALDHPNLLRLFEAGECEVAGQRYLYAVMEYAEQNLAQLLEHRALGPDEVREMLGPTLNALEFLHGSKRVHGGLKPSNVLVVGEHVKLASDTIGPASDGASSGGAGGAALSPYQPPEASSGARLPAGDVWSLGVMTCEAFSRRRPAGLQAIAGSIALPPDIPSPFAEMISKCLRRNPAERPDIARLQAWQKGGELEATPAPSEQAAGIADDVRAPAEGVVIPGDAQAPGSSGSFRLVIRAELKPQDELGDPAELRAQWRPMRLIAAGIVLVAIVGAGIYFFGPSQTPPAANAPAAPPRVAAETPRPEAAPLQAPTTQGPSTEAAPTRAPRTDVAATQSPPMPAPPVRAPATQSPPTRPPSMRASATPAPSARPPATAKQAPPATQPPRATRPPRPTKCSPSSPAVRATPSAAPSECPSR